MARVHRKHYIAAPVGDTCPIIDEIKSIRAGAIEALEGMQLNEEDAAERVEQIEALDGARRDLLEQVRHANQELRDWGAQGRADLEAAQAELKDAEQERDQLQRTVDRLEREAA